MHGIFSPVILMLFFLLASTTACDAPRRDTAPPVVITSIAPIGDWLRAIGGDDVQVEVLIPRNASPHTFELRPRQLRHASDAALAVFMGAGLEVWAPQLLASTGAQTQALYLSEGQRLLQTGDDHAHADGHVHAEGNPHLWLDPVFAIDAAQRIADALMRMLPENKAAIQDRADAWKDSLRALDAAIRAERADWSQSRFVGDHSSWVYFAARYGLEQRGVIEAIPGREISAQSLGGLIDRMRTDSIRAVFADVRKASRAAQVLSESTGAAVALLDPIGSERSALRYLDLMRYNVAEMSRVMR